MWEADLTPMPGGVRDRIRERMVAAMVVAEEVALEGEILMISGAELEDVAQALERALATAAGRVGNWPAEIRVRHPEVAEVLEPLVRERGCRVYARGPRGALDSFARDLAGHLSGADLWPLASAPETWAAWGLPEPLVADLFRAYAAYYRAAPWRWLDDVPPLAADWEDGAGIWTLSVIGAAMGEFGMSVFSQPRDFGDLLDLDDGDIPHQELKGWLVHLGYIHRQDLPRPMVKEISRSGWEVESVEAYPYILPINTPGGGLQQDLVRRLIRLLHGVVELVEKYGSRLRSPEGGSFMWSGDGLTLLYAVAPDSDLSEADTPGAGFPELDLPMTEPPSELQELIHEMEEAGLESEEEVRAFLEERLDDYNQTPMEGLGGISPAQAQTLIEGGLEGEGILQVSQDLTPAELAGSDYLANARLFLERVAEEGGIKATATGNLKRAFVAEMLDGMRLPPGHLAEIHRMNKVVNEHDAWLLHELRVNLDLAGLIKLRKGTFSVTRQGRGFLPPASAGRLFAHLFHTYFGRFDLEYGRRIRDSSHLQAVVPLLLWQIGYHAPDWISVAELADRVLPPRRNSEPDGLGSSFRGDILDFRYLILKPLERFGLVESELTPEAAGQRYPDHEDVLVRTTPLHPRVLRFEWE